MEEGNTKGKESKRGLREGEKERRRRQAKKVEMEVEEGDSG